MPAIPYPGGKARLAKQIIAFLPPEGRNYVEPFAGRGNLFWAAACAGLKYDKWWLNDTATIPFFRAIKQVGHVIEVPHCATHEYERQRDAYSSGDPTAILLEPFLTFTGGGYLYSGFRGDKRGGVSSVGYQKTLRECHTILSRTRPRLSHLDWREMRLDELGPKDTVVLDPPYADTTPLSYTDATVDYHELVDLLLRAKFRWVLCGYIHPALHRLGDPCWANSPW
jgi:site-specific DNA-adenine methylase